MFIPINSHLRAGLHHVLHCARPATGHVCCPDRHNACTGAGRLPRPVARRSAAAAGQHPRAAPAEQRPARRRAVDASAVLPAPRRATDAATMCGRHAAAGVVRERRVPHSGHEESAAERASRGESDGKHTGQRQRATVGAFRTVYQQWWVSFDTNLSVSINCILCSAQPKQSTPK